MTVTFTDIPKPPPEPPPEEWDEEVTEDLPEEEQGDPVPPS